LLYGVAASDENDRYRRRGGLGRQSSGSAGCRNQIHLASNEVFRQPRQSIVFAFGGAVLEVHVPAFDIAHFRQASMECADEMA
jgi:hypothetical protein